MRTIISIVLLAVALTVSGPSPSEAQCQCVCRGGICRWVCRQPRYVVPSYEEPRYVTPYQSYVPVVSAGPSFSPELVALILLFGAGALIAFLAHVFSTNEVEADTAANNKIAEEMEEMMRKADAHIAAMIAKSRDGDRHD